MNAGRMDKIWLHYITEDKIDLNRNGFTLKWHGRCPCIYFVEDNSVVCIDGEAPGNNEFDILLFGEPKYITKRYFLNPKRAQTLSTAESLKVHKLLCSWLEGSNIRHDIKKKYKYIDVPIWRQIWYSNTALCRYTLKAQK